MGKGKDLPAVDFHAVVARRDPALAERLVREGIAPAAAEPSATPALTIVRPEAEAPVAARESKLDTAEPTRRRGIVSRAGGREAGRITLYVPSDLALRLREHCFARDRTMTDVAGEILIQALERHLSG